MFDWKDDMYVLKTLQSNFFLKTGLYRCKAKKSFKLNFNMLQELTVDVCVV